MNAIWPTVLADPVKALIEIYSNPSPGGKQWIDRLGEWAERGAVLRQDEQH